MHLLQHCFTSAEGMCEAYNEMYRDGPKAKFFKDFLSVNKNVGGHFRRKDEELIEDRNEEEVEEETGEKVDRGAELLRSNMHLAHRKNLSMAFYCHEIVKEMKERGHTETTIFGPRDDPQDARKKISYKESFEEYMRTVDSLRRNELYAHPSSDCSSECAKRGCGRVASIDGNWKLNYKVGF